MAAEKKEKNKLNVRDYITLAIIIVLVLFVYMLGSPLGFTPVGFLFIHAVCSIFWGSIFFLAYMKVNKKGTPLVISVVIAIFMFMSAWQAGLFILVAGILIELLWEKMDRTKVKTMSLVFTLQIFSWYLTYIGIVAFLTQNAKNADPNNAALFDSVKNILSLPMFLLGILALLVGTALGSFIGSKVLKKHFLKAGIV